MEKITEFAQKIGLNDFVILKIQETFQNKDFVDFLQNQKEKYLPLLNPLESKDVFVVLDKNFEKFCNFDELKKGFLWLSFSLFVAQTETIKIYQQKNISEEIFIETLKAFSRFVEEHKNSFGFFGFDRAFWTYRQLSGVLFRLGTLEFELCPQNVYIHIPSNAKITKENCIESIKMAQVFIKEHFSLYENKPFFTETWLLSPALKEFLLETSNILNFQSLFDICGENQDDNSFIEWVFKTNETNPNNWEEKTSLQRAIKKHILSGKKIGTGSGTIKKEFL